MKSFMRLVSRSVCRAQGEVVLRRASYTSSEKWVITNMCPARLSQVTPWCESPLKQNIFEQAFIWRAIRHSSPDTTRNIKLLNSSDFSETPGKKTFAQYYRPIITQNHHSKHLSNPSLSLAPRSVPHLLYTPGQHITAQGVCCILSDSPTAGNDTSTARRYHTTMWKCG